ncbi:uncharacterized protein L203_100692 [Cryptococcus depauperatus CBS 7841]|uniref:Uncharacterized protein n=1 Tax=Cryptococcus depauperatus CBS 7841 TaxID=1295531 RepID=A0A1E3IZT0_9TREE|nr:hypothetical protein L203_00481 [Cryptococcus depauperatus CBS 7841]
MSVQEQFCTMCRESHGHLVTLEADPTGLWVCSSCGLVDERTTSARILVDVNKHGIQVDDNIKGIKANAWNDWKEAQFEDHVNSLLHLYLGIPDVRTSFLGVSGHSLRSSARHWLDRIIDVERQHFKRLHGHSKAGPKTKFLVVIAIKMALEESISIVVNNKLKAAGIPIKTRSFVGPARGDEGLPNLSISQISDRLSRYPEGSFGYINRENYLSTLYRRFTRLLRNTPSPIEGTLIHVWDIIQRLQIIIETPHEERAKILLTRPQEGKNGYREWDTDEFAFFDGLEWGDVLPQAYQLYRLQECVYLWGNRVSPGLSIALTFWAIQTIKKEVMPSFSLLMNELSAPYGQQKWVALERFREMRNLLVAWSTSIPDACLPYPLLPLPQKGIIGDGEHSYGSDKRRGIPEIDMAVAAAPTIAQHWQHILQTRFRTRRDAMSLEDETYLARKMFVIRAEAYAALLDPKVNSSSLLRLVPHTRVSGRAGAAIKKYREYAEVARKQVLEFEPFQRVCSKKRNFKTVSAVFTPHSFKTPSFPLNELEQTSDKSESQNTHQGQYKHQEKNVTQTLAQTRGSIPASLSKHTAPVDISVDAAIGIQRRVYPAPSSHLPSRPHTPPSDLPADLHGPFQTSYTNDAHVGVLIREREQYIKFRCSTYIEQGHIVDEVCEKYMWDWLRQQVQAGSMPPMITVNYLRSIGIDDNPRQIDLGPWIELKKDLWSPVECLLRAGIKPKEIPHQHLPYSVVHLKLLLKHYCYYRESNLLRSENEHIDEQQLDRELHILFSSETGETLESIFLTHSEVEKRKKEYERMGLLDDDEDRNAGCWRSNFCEDIDDDTSSKASGISIYQESQVDSSESIQSDIVSTSPSIPNNNRIPSVLYQPRPSSKDYGINTLAMFLENGEKNDFENNCEKYEEVLLGSLDHEVFAPAMAINDDEDLRNYGEMARSSKEIGQRNLSVVGKRKRTIQEVKKTDKIKG